MCNLDNSNSDEMDPQIRLCTKETLNIVLLLSRDGRLISYNLDAYDGRLVDVFQGNSRIANTRNGF